MKLSEVQQEPLTVMAFWDDLENHVYQYKDLELFLKENKFLFGQMGIIKDIRKENIMKMINRAIEEVASKQERHIHGRMTQENEDEMYAELERHAGEIKEFEQHVSDELDDLPHITLCIVYGPKIRSYDYVANDADFTGLYIFSEPSLMSPRRFLEEIKKTVDNLRKVNLR